MRILMLCYEFPPIGGGGGRFAHQLGAHVAERGHEVDVVTMGFGDLPARERVDGMEVHRVPCVRLQKYECSIPEVATYLPGALLKARKLASERRYDLNHTHYILPDGALAYSLKRSFGTPFVVTAHGSDVPSYNPDRLHLAHRILGPLWERVVGGAKQVLSPSEHLRGLILDRASDARVTRIPYGFEATRFCSDRPKHEKILVVTRMVKRKGVQYLLKTLRDLELGSWEVHIVGDGPYLSTLQDMAAEWGLQVRFWGWLDNDSEELAELYETAGIFVMASESENFPVSLLEAMGAGAAIVTTSGTGCAEVVGDTALLFPPRDATALGERLRELMDDPDLRRDLGRAARTRLEEELSWNTVTERYLALYQRVLAAGNGAGDV